MEGFDLNINKISQPGADPYSTIRKELDDDLTNALDQRTLKPEVLLLIKVCRLLRQLKKVKND
jgi:hypothetical protein